jgi:hypothetical protein
MSNIRNSVVLVGLLASLVLCFSISARSQDEEADQYSIRLVKGLLDQPEGASVSWLDKARDRLGDRAAIALVKIFGEQELLQPKNLHRSLQIIHGAFSAPCLIEIESDRKPSITLFVLRDLEGRVKDETLRKEITSTKTFVEQGTSASCNGGKGGS